MNKLNLELTPDKEENPHEENFLLARAKKRPISQISKDDSNSIDIEEYHELKKVKEPRDNNEVKEKVYIKIQDSLEEESEPEIIIEPEKPPEEPPKVIEESQEPPIIPTGPGLWLNKLKYYPQNTKHENILSFRELMFENLSIEGSKKTLQAIFTTSFKYDIRMLEPLVKEGVKLTLVTEATDPSQSKIEKNVLGYPNFTLIQLPKNTYLNFIGAFHAKLWVLKFPDFLRVVICTGDLTPLDWAFWSNCIWFKDFHRIMPTENGNAENKKGVDNQKLSDDFKNTLKSFINHLMPNSINYSHLLDFNLDNYVFSDVDIILIPSVPGRHRDKEFDKYGHKKIDSILKKLVPKPQGINRNEYTLTYVTNSFGNLNEKFLKEFLSSIFPNFINLDELKAEKRYNKELTPSGDNLLKRVKIVFPTKQYVENSIEGPQYSGCLSLSSDCYYNESFPKKSFYQFQTPESYSFYQGTIPHYNIFIVTDSSEEINDNTYIYYGSHNLSASAWGKFEKDYSQLSIINYDLGVFFPPGKGTHLIKKKLIESLPFKFPPVPYTKEDVPWISTLYLKEEQ